VEVIASLALMERLHGRHGIGGAFIGVQGGMNASVGSQQAKLDIFNEDEMLRNARLG
jgi:hypothetical protein